MTMPRITALLATAAAFFAFAVVGASAAPGDLDRSFGRNGIVITGVRESEGRALALQQNGRIVAVGTPGIEIDRFLPNGDLDATFGDGGRASVLDACACSVDPTAAGVDSQGRIVIAGTLRRPGAQSNSDLVVLRVLPGGDLDTSFGDQGLVPIDPGADDEAVARLEIRPSDSVLVGGVSYSGQGSAAVVARVDDQGDLDSSYGDGGMAIVPLRGGVAAMDVDAFGGATLAGDDARRVRVVRLTPSGELDDSFSGDGRRKLDLGRREWVRTVAFGKHGRIFVGGSVVQRKPRRTSRTNLALARLKPSGSLDRRFGGDGMVTKNLDRFDWASGLEPQADGKLVVSGIGDHFSLGYPQRWVVLRYRRNGRLDRSFSGNGVAFPKPSIFGSSPVMEMQPDGRILLLGWSWEDDASNDSYGFMLARMRNDGRPRITSPKASASPTFSAG
jgi:uncharacterized delta-60 repeat protein